MDGFRGYCYSLIVVTVCTGVVMLLAPEKGGMTKYIRWITALCVTSTLLIPLASLGEEMKLLIDGDLQYEHSSVDENTSRELLITAIEDEISDVVSSALKERFKVVCDEVTVEMDTIDIENISLLKITAVIDTKSEFLITDCRKFLEELFMCKIEVKGKSEIE